MTEVDGFEVFDAKHCETAATKCLLRHEGLDFSEPMLLGLGQGFGFIYWKMSFMSLPFIGGRAKPFELTRTFCRNMGIVVDERQTTSRKKAWLNVTQSIDRGVPVGLQLDCYHLEHFQHSFHFAGHFAAIHGYDSSNAYVFDTGKDYKVSLDNLEKARFEKGSMAARALSYTVSSVDDVSAIGEVIPKAVSAIAGGFLHPPLRNFGYYGILKLSHEMANWIDVAPNPADDLHDQAELMENGGTGGAIFRNFFRDFLRECLDYLPGNRSLTRAANLYAQAADNWTEVARLIKKAGRTGERDHLEKASQMCKQTAEIEKEAMERLSAL